ncbi:uncharacterized protein [Solanum tuberosum]|uniref:uncharacterized protein n=1 Tax=Solanum tuberosum TaxID=4113 RepID=UPI00073A153A|nr:PREDICTED: uncharacterized protein LOC107062166 [Solanum tuberosum]
MVLIKVSPMQGVVRFGKKGKLSLQNMSPFKILDCVGPVAYRLALTPNLSGIHPVFHVSMLKRYHRDGDNIIKWDSVLLYKDLQYGEELVAILDRNVRKLRTKEINSVKFNGSIIRLRKLLEKPRRTCDKRWEFSLQGGAALAWWGPP